MVGRCFLILEDQRVQKGKPHHISYCPHGYDKILDKKQFKKGKMYSDIQLRDTFHPSGEGEAGAVAGGGD